MAQKKLINYKKVMPNYDAAKWCINNGYKVYPVPVRPFNSVRPKYYICMQSGKKVSKSKQEFSKDEWSGAVWHTYEFLYKKHSGR